MILHPMFWAMLSLLLVYADHPFLGFACAIIGAALATTKASAIRRLRRWPLRIKVRFLLAYINGELYEAFGFREPQSLLLIARAARKSRRAHGQPDDTLSALKSTANGLDFLRSLRRFDA